MLSVFRRDLDAIFDLLRCYAA